MLEDAKKGLFDVIVCDEWSRASRQEPLDSLALMVRPLKRAEVLLDTVLEGLQDWDTLAGLIMTLINSNTANKGSKETAHRVHSNARLRVMQGRPAGGGAPFGYKWEYGTKEVGNRDKPDPLRLVPDDLKADVVKEMFKRYDSGTVSILDLVKLLEERGIEPPRARKKGKTRWSRSSVRVVLKNDVYTGRYDYGRQTASKYTTVENGKVVPKKKPGKPAGRKSMPIADNPANEWVVSPIPHEALISQELFDNVKARLSGNCDGRNVGRRKGYLLSDLLVCGHCGRTLNGHYSKSRRGV